MSKSSAAENRYFNDLGAQASIVLGEPRLNGEDQVQLILMTIAGATIGTATGMIAGIAASFVVIFILVGIAPPGEFNGFDMMGITFYFVIIFTVIGIGYGAFKGFRKALHSN